mmetsp:Transcript_5120/g.18711  ORF Transcript_5120/g.18711 Transcript_5120/m.18711 type:complete len:137 (-) Transcript_5120:403-813(-)
MSTTWLLLALQNKGQRRGCKWIARPPWPRRPRHNSPCLATRQVSRLQLSVRQQRLGAPHWPRRMCDSSRQCLVDDAGEAAWVVLGNYLFIAFFLAVRARMPHSTATASAYEASYALAVAVECGMRARTAKKNAMKR